MTIMAQLPLVMISYPPADCSWRRDLAVRSDGAGGYVVGGAHGDVASGGASCTSAALDGHVSDEGLGSLPLGT